MRRIKTDESGISSVFVKIRDNFCEKSRIFFAKPLTPTRGYGIIMGEKATLFEK